METAKELFQPGDGEWIQEAVVRFLQGPCYTAPLMGYIDENCAVFDTEEENKLEYTQVYNDFKVLVERLLSDFLNELGVGNDEFVAAVQAGAHTQRLSSFVLSSILTVDDFLQFRAMMVKRNMDLTNEVLAFHDAQERALQLEAARESARAVAHLKAVDGGTPGKHFKKEAKYVYDSEEEEEEMDEELSEALILSKQQFTRDLERIVQEDRKAAEKLNILPDEDEEERGEEGGREEDEELSRVLRMSLVEQCRLETERAELEQAIALSLALEEERERLEKEEEENKKVGEEEQSPTQTNAEKGEEVASVVVAIEGNDDADGVQEEEEEEEEEEDQGEVNTDAGGEEAPLPDSPGLEKEKDTTAGTETQAEVKEEEEMKAESIPDEPVVALAPSAEEVTPPPPPPPPEAVAQPPSPALAPLPQPAAAVVPQKPAPLAVQSSTIKRAAPSELPQKAAVSGKAGVSAVQMLMRRGSSSTRGGGLPPMAKGPDASARGSKSNVAVSSQETSLRRKSGYSSGGNAANLDFGQIREAAALAAKSQKEMLHRKEESVKIAQANVKKAQMQRSASSNRRQQDFIAQQRQQLVASKAKERERELKDYLEGKNGQIPPSPKGPKTSETGGGGGAGQQDDARANLRLELARCVKQELLSRMA